MKVVSFLVIYSLILSNSIVIAKELNSIRAINIYEIPKTTYGLIENLNNNIEIFTNIGVFEYDKTTLYENKFFNNKSPVLKASKNKESIIYLHFNLDITIFNKKEYFTITKNNILNINEFNVNNIKFIENINDRIILQNHKKDYYEVIYTDFNKISLIKLNHISIEVKTKVFKSTKDFNISISNYKILIQYKKNNLIFYTKIEDEINDVIQDYEGNIWFSTNNDGLFLIKTQFTEYKIKNIIKKKDDIYHITDSLYYSRYRGFYLLTKKYNIQNSRTTYFIKNDTLFVGYNAFFYKGQNYLCRLPLFSTIQK